MPTDHSERFRLKSHSLGAVPGRVDANAQCDASHPGAWHADVLVVVEARRWGAGMAAAIC